MRVLSQDGMIDVPYEQVVIRRFKGRIYFLNKNLTGVENPVNDMELASYSDEAKAQRAMEMLHEAYELYVMYKTMLTQEKEIFLRTQSEKERKMYVECFNFLMMMNWRIDYESHYT